MNWNAILGIACIFSFSLPAAVIVYNRFYAHNSLVALLIYFVMKAVYTVMNLGFISVTSSFISASTLFEHYLDIPLMLATLIFFCPNKQKQRLMWKLIFSFIAYEIAISCFYGFTDTSVMYITGPGRALILVYSFYLFMRQVKFSVMHRKSQGRIIMLVAILFAYACYSLIFYFYYVLKTPYKSDTLLLYFISSFIASTLMGIGLHLMRKRMKELQSLKITRKELAMFFSH